ncbi:MAG: hypothetical protein Ct9H300mP12_09560 [Acidimicrobiales bacterium]|nr:MAG: hypothetical protein Ct9H300mP12_09560 [Acidimicrobiales bacterium]
MRAGMLEARQPFRPGTGEALTLPAIRPVAVQRATVVADEVFVTLAEDGEVSR